MSKKGARASHDIVAVPDPNTQSTFVADDTIPAGFSLRRLHPLLKEQLRSLRSASRTDRIDVRALLQLISSCYDGIDDERRGMVRSMQLMSDEARALGADRGVAGLEHLQVILDHIKDVVITVDAEGTIETVNPMAERVFGYASSEIFGRRLDLLLPEIAVGGTVAEGLATLAAASDSSGAGMPSDELLARRKDGGRFTAEIAVSSARTGRAHVYVVCLRDISERLDSERQLRESEARFRTLVDNAPEAILVLDVDANCFVDANENATRFFGHARESLLSMSPDDISADFQSDGLPTVGPKRGYIEQALADEPQTFEWLHRDGRGQEVLCEVRLVRLPSSAGRLLRASITDIRSRKRQELITQGERAVFECLASHAPLAQALASIAQLIESVYPRYRCAISLLSADRATVQVVAAASLPPRLRAVLDNSPVDLQRGTCAAALYLGRPVLAADVATDPHSAARREVLLDAGVRAMWSVPIKDASGRLLGSVAICSPAAGLPDAAETELQEHAVRLAGIAIERSVAEEALRASEARFRGLFETVMEGVFQSTYEGQMTSVNEAMVRMLGYDSAEELYALPSVEMLYWRANDRRQLIREIAERGSVRAREVALRRRDGGQVFALASIRAVYDVAGAIVAFEGTLADITERKRAEQAVFAERDRAQVTLQSIGDAVISTDADGRIDYLNPVAERLTGWSLAEARGAPVDEVLVLVDESSRAPQAALLGRVLTNGEAMQPSDARVLVNRQEQDVAIQDSASPIRNRDGQITGSVIVFSDVTHERRLKRALSYQASHDALTGLINRREFDLRLEMAVATARHNQAEFALLYVDLDQFKLINDTCGHSAGDRLLRDITGLLQTRVRAADTIARLGGDEFGVLLENCSIEQAEKVAENVREAIHDYRFNWSDSKLSVGASIGVVQINSDTVSAAAALSAADVACYAAKDGGRNRVHVYETDAGSNRHREMQWVSRITRGVEENRLRLFSQQIVALGSARPIADFHELTVRLRDETGSIVMPNEFIPAAERYNIMSMVDGWVVARAIELLHKRIARNEPVPVLAVNLSGTTLSNEDFLEFLITRLADERLARGLCFEITETAAVSSLANAVYFMRELKARGCRFALDDFGSGLSSFMYLKTLPVDFLKIDGQFIAQVERDSVDRSMVEAIAKVGEALGIETIAERVETAGTLDVLRGIGVDYVQGFHLQHPRAVEEWLD
ncbi:MAG TPA: PAS domain S-box protein [Steroidobacteraceae bacterium]|nr:PAS domain S-box protein [Steroidobacteraceae bacterium]HRX89424.1 PAS domain S-box protein [Steroidobacteraceae bacterium]